jgi:hypothetical protein
MSYFNQSDNSGSGSRCLRLPKPDPANITVLTPNLPNKPILPWTHFDSPWLESETQQSEESEESQTQESTESTDNNQEAINSSERIDD